MPMTADEEHIAYVPLLQARCATHYVLSPDGDAYDEWHATEVGLRRAQLDENYRALEADRFNPIMVTRPVHLSGRIMHPEAVVVYLDGWEADFPATGPQTASNMIAKARARGIQRYGSPPQEVLHRIINEQMSSSLNGITSTHHFTCPRDGVVQLPGGAIRSVSAGETIRYPVTEGQLNTVTYIDPVVNTTGVEISSPSRPNLSLVTHYIVSPTVRDYQQRIRDLQGNAAIAQHPRRVSTAHDLRGLNLQSHQRIEFVGEWRAMVDLPEIVNRFRLQRDLRPAEHGDFGLDRAVRHLSRIDDQSVTVTGESDEGGDVPVAIQRVIDENGLTNVASQVMSLQRQLAQKTSECNSLRRTLNRISNNSENYTLQERTQAQHVLDVANGLTIMWRPTRNPNRWLLVSTPPAALGRTAVYKWDDDRRQFVTAAGITVAVITSQAADDDLVFDEEDEDSDG